LNCALRRDTDILGLLNIGHIGLQYLLAVWPESENKSIVKPRGGVRCDSKPLYKLMVHCW